MSAAQTLLDDMQAFITTLQEGSRTAVMNAQGITQYTPDVISVTPVSAPTPYTAGEPPLAPEFQLIPEITSGDLPTLQGSFQVISPLFVGDEPTFDVDPPAIDFGDKPSQLKEFLEKSPSIKTAFEFPDPLPGASQVFDAPTFSAHTAPTAPVVVIPSFDAIMPDNDASAPTNLVATQRSNFSEMDAVLHSVAESHMDGFLAKINPQYATQMQAIESQLANYLAGGTGLSVEVEEAIYNRARARNDLEARKIQDAAFADAAARGFTLPSGALTSALARARQDAANNQNKTTNEIVVMQAEMEQKNLQFAVSTSSDLRKSAVSSMLAYFQSSISMSNMALDYAKSITNALVQVYDIQVKVFASKLDAYKAEASVYETKSRAAMFAIEVYKSQIQAFEAMINVDKSKVDLYRAQIGTLRDYAEIHKSQVEAVVSEASIEKLRIELFQSQVQAYSAEVQAKSAEWQGYQARLAGEEAKVKVFSAQAEAFNSKVAAFKAQHEATSEKIKAESSHNSAMLQDLSGRLGAYEANVRSKTAIASGNIETLRQHYAAHKGAIDFAVATEQMKLEGYKANVSATLQTAKQSIDAQVSNAGVAANVLDALSKVHGEILKIYSGPANAAAAGMTSLASINFQE